MSVPGGRTLIGNITNEVLVAGFPHAAGADLFDDAVLAQFEIDERIPECPARHGAAGAWETRAESCVLVDLAATIEKWPKRHVVCPVALR